MMRVVFFDKARETYYAVGNVIQLDNVMEKVSGRLTGCWKLTLPDGTCQTFSKKWFEIHRIEI